MRTGVGDKPVALNWPTGLDDNMRRLLQHTLSVSADTAHHQDVLDALAHKLLDREDPLRNPVAYAIKLCSRIKTGAFQPVGPPLDTRPNENSHAEPARPGKSVLRSQLSNELSGLKRLRTAGRQDASAAMLDRQIADLEVKLSDLREVGR